MEVRIHKLSSSAACASRRASPIARASYLRRPLWGASVLGVGRSTMVVRRVLNVAHPRSRWNPRNWLMAKLCLCHHSK